MLMLSNFRQWGTGITHNVLMDVFQGYLDPWPPYSGQIYIQYIKWMLRNSTNSPIFGRGDCYTNVGMNVFNLYTVLSLRYMMMMTFRTLFVLNGYKLFCNRKTHKCLSLISVTSSFPLSSTSTHSNFNQTCFLSMGSAGLDLWIGVAVLLFGARSHQTFEGFRSKTLHIHFREALPPETHQQVSGFTLTYKPCSVGNNLKIIMNHFEP